MRTTTNIHRTTTSDDEPVTFPAPRLRRRARKRIRSVVDLSALSPSIKRWLLAGLTIERLDVTYLEELLADAEAAAEGLKLGDIEPGDRLWHHGVFRGMRL